MKPLEKVPPAIRAEVTRLCIAKRDASRAHWRKVAPGRFPDCFGCVENGTACQACIDEAQTT